MRVLIALLALLLATCIAHLGAASAQDVVSPPTTPPTTAVPPTTASAGVSDGTIAVSVGAIGTPPGTTQPNNDGNNTDRNGNGTTCTYSIPDAVVQSSTDPGKIGFDPAGTTKNIGGIPHRLYLRSCTNGSDGTFTTTFIWIAETSTAQLVDSAYDKVVAALPLPTLNTSPPDHVTYVNYNTWLWTDPTQWHTITRTASATTLGGNLSATVTATPIRLSYQPGEPGADPAVIDCTGPGQPWTSHLSQHAESDCMYSYHHSSEISDTDTFAATWTIYWNIIATTNGNTTTIDSAYPTSNLITITVDEIQALIVE